ncbi:hypothetical protein FHW96_003383 [Novosphingobium sp. SG751A]|uniref:SH3 domain-containing protein n=1 Tax=Novosphingobium sp. SG751A TaxID=2587000 RepID=UPI0015540C0E|nr:SH3 domain-containing protein [Novosphingobium sp. SG751A]NOW47205.1 hypothetical protein [Novosphingobium sp. SG751A]
MFENQVPALGASFALSGPAAKPDPAHVPVRGDVAHIRLAGQVFVPHYVVPMPHRAMGETKVLRAPGGEAIASLNAGAQFDVLDLAGGHAWGEIPGGMVGYIAADQLEKLA